MNPLPRERYDEGSPLWRPFVLFVYSDYYFLPGSYLAKAACYAIMQEWEIAPGYAHNGGILWNSYFRRLPRGFCGPCWRSVFLSHSAFWISRIFPFFGGCIAGAVTGFLHTKLKIPALLAGILTMIGLYSINLRIMGRATTSILGEETVYSFFENNMSKVSATLIVGLLATLVVWFFCYIFFGTELGAAIRATGDNPQMIRAQGINTDVTIMLGLIISNGFVGVTGALLSQSNGYADVNMGTGVLVTGLASIIIGEVLFGTRSFKNWLISVVLGSIVYRAVVAFVLWLGMNPNDLKLLTAVIVAVALALPLIKSKMQKLRSNM